MAVTAAPQQGHGLSITFESGFCAWIIDFQAPKLKRAALETTNNTTTTARTYRPEQLYDGGEMQVTLQFNAATTPPITSAAGNFTITFPMASGASVASNWTGSGFLTGYDASVPMNAIMTVNATIKITGAVTFNAAS